MASLHHRHRERSEAVQPSATPRHALDHAMAALRRVQAGFRSAVSAPAWWRWRYRAATRLMRRTGSRRIDHAWRYAGNLRSLRDEGCCPAEAVDIEIAYWD